MNTLNIAMILENAACRQPGKTFLVAGELRLTFAELDRLACRAAGMFSTLGVRPGERVALLMANTPALVSCFYGALKAGTVPVPINPLAPGPEVAHFLVDSEAAALVATGALAEAALAGFTSAGTCRCLVLDDLPEGGTPPAPAQRLTELMAAADDVFETALTRPEDPAVVLFTSGTTGRPKGAVITHFNLYFAIRTMVCDFWQVSPSDVVLWTAPVAHIFGLVILNMACLARAALSLPGKPDIGGYADAIARDHVTFFAGVPVLAYKLLYSPQSAGRALPSLRKVMLSGTTLPPELVEQFQKRFGVEVITGYGMTEAVPITFLPAEEMKGAPPGSVGRPAWGTRVQVVDETGAGLPPGRAGEILIRGPQVCAGYQNRPEATAEAFRDGWFHTGDAGYFDPDGYLFLVDRVKDIIKVSGYSVYPAEVERVLMDHPAVAEAAVVGLPHKAMGNRLKAFVVLKPGAVITARELTAYCRGQLSSYKCPRLIEFRESLPAGPSGKPLKRELLK